MTYSDLLSKGRRLSDKERDLALTKLLVAREEGPALVAWLEDFIKAEYVRAFADQKMANYHGSLEHCAGSICAVQKILDDLAQLIVVPGPTRPRPE